MTSVVVHPYSAGRVAVLHGRTERDGGRILRMLLDLSDAELSTAATACRAIAYQEGERVKAMSNPDMRRPIENSAQRSARLAERFEAATKTSPQA
jgi:predicted nuclease with RNAse H fold